MKFSSVIVFALLSTVATTLASPIDKRAASAAVQKQNADDAKALNAKFATLTTSSSCTNGENACVNGQFAQCSNGKFALSPCASGTTCCALPLVNSRGTSITCDTPADRDARIAAAEGSSGSAPAPATTTTSKPAGAAAAAATTSASTAPQSTPASTSSTSGGDIASIRKQNAADAIAQQNAANSLTPNSSCTNGQITCVNGQVAQCTNSKFALTPCAGGTKCFILPLVNKRGTSTTCDTQADRDARIAAAQQGQS